MSTLTETEWLDHGLKTLASEGAGAVKADRLAKSLGVSRGSFYWHFADIATYRRAMLDLWAARTTQGMILRLKGRAAGGASSRLDRLLQLAMRTDDGLERAVRSWATHDAGAQKAVRGVDAVRLSHLRESLAAAGLAQDDAEARATILYLAYVGRLMVNGPAAAASPEALRHIAMMLRP